MSMEKKNGLNAVVLAGGQSRRFGSNKAFALLNGRPLISILTDQLERAGFSVSISAASSEKYTHLGHPVIEDLFPSEGPLNAIYSSLKQDKNDGKILFTTCDMPLLKKEILHILWGKSCGMEITYLETTKKISPFPGVYAKTIIPYIEKMLAQKKRDVRSLLKAPFKTKMIPRNQWHPYDPRELSHFNINTPQNLETAKTLITTHRSNAFKIFE